MRFIRSKRAYILISLSFVTLVSSAKSIDLNLVNVMNQTSGPGGEGLPIKTVEGSRQYCVPEYPGVTEPVWESPLNPGETSRNSVNLPAVSYGQNVDLSCVVKLDGIPSPYLKFTVTRTAPGTSAPGCTNGNNCLCLKTTSCSQMFVSLGKTLQGQFDLYVGYAPQNCLQKPICFYMK